MHMTYRYCRPKVRLLFHPSLGTPEKMAALQGLWPFEKYHIRRDCVDVKPSGRVQLDGVKSGSKIRKIVLAENPVVCAKDFRPSIMGALFLNKNIFGLGITPKPIRESNGIGAPEYRIGLSLPGVGGVVSINRKPDDERLYPASITAAVKHELGHIFGGKSHCNDQKCIMQENTDYADFIARFVVPALGFCRGCQEKITAAISKAAQS
jgi:hypothetical protein